MMRDHIDRGRRGKGKREREGKRRGSGEVEERRETRKEIGTQLVPNQTPGNLR